MQNHSVLHALRRFVLLCLGLVFSSVALSQTCTEYGVYIHPDGNKWFTSAEAACSYWKSATGIVSGSPRVNGTTCEVVYVDGNGAELPQGSTTITTRSADCGDPVCKSMQGQDFTLNWSLGYTRTPLS